MTIRTVTVSGVTAVNFNPDSDNPLFYTDERFCWIRNNSEAVMYASLDEYCVAGAFGTIAIPAGEAGMIALTPANVVYISGSGSAEVRTQDFPDCPFKKKAKGGGESVLIEKSVTANGVYSAADDSADGYSEVTVNVKSHETLLYEGITSSSVQPLGDSITNYDEIMTISTEGTQKFTRKYPVSCLSVGQNIGCTTDTAYHWVNLYSTSSIQAVLGNGYIKIIGIK